MKQGITLDFTAPWPRAPAAAPALERAALSLAAVLSPPSRVPPGVSRYSGGITLSLGGTMVPARPWAGCCRLSACLGQQGWGHGRRDAGLAQGGGTTSPPQGDRDTGVPRHGQPALGWLLQHPDLAQDRGDCFPRGGGESITPSFLPPPWPTALRASSIPAQWWNDPGAGTRDASSVSAHFIATGATGQTQFPERGLGPAPSPL